MEDAGCRIERARAADAGLMLDFWKPMPGLGISLGEEEEDVRAFIERNPSTCLVIWEQERLIGTVMGSFDGRRGYLYHLAVHPDFRGRGYGRALLNQVISELRSLGAQKIHLFAYNDNQTAAAFYRRQGWEARKDIQVFSWVNRQEN